MMSESHSGSMHFVMMPLATVVQPSSSDGTTRKVLRGGGTVLLETAVLDISVREQYIAIVLWLPPPPIPIAIFFTTPHQYNTHILQYIAIVL